MIPCQELNAKRQIRVKSSYERIMYQNKILNYISTKLPKAPLSLWAENWIHLSHKRTLWIEEPESKIQKERHAGGLIWKGQKFKSTKGAKWHGNEEQMNISVYHMLQFNGVQAGSYLKTEVTNETHLLGLKRVILTWKYWFPLS